MKLLKSMLLTVALGLAAVQTQAQTPQPASAVQQQEVVDLFFAAARTGNSEVINEFLKYGFPVDVRNKDGYTPLMMASYYGHSGIVNRLLEQGADRCLRDNKGNTALMGAIFKLEWSIAKQLKSVDCDVNAKKTGQKTVAEFAKVIGQEEKLKQLME
jgi:hypothetical protein